MPKILLDPNINAPIPQIRKGASTQQETKIKGLNR
jgi:hypothetical protein